MELVYVFLQYNGVSIGGYCSVQNTVVGEQAHLRSNADSDVVYVEQKQ